MSEVKRALHRAKPPSYPDAPASPDVRVALFSHAPRRRSTHRRTFIADLSRRPGTWSGYSPMSSALTRIRSIYRNERQDVTQLWLEQQQTRQDSGSLRRSPFQFVLRVFESAIHSLDRRATSSCVPPYPRHMFVAMIDPCQIQPAVR